MPIITLEVLSDSSNPDQYIQTINNSYTEETNSEDNAQDSILSAGVHFLTDKGTGSTPVNENESKDQDASETLKARTELLEYVMRNDGSVICKLCGEILQSRTHWYRHKYKVHVIQPLNPAPLFQCEQCLIFFKSRKGYIGHLSSRHSETLSDSSPVLTNSQAETLAKELAIEPPQHEVKEEEPDPELIIPKTSVPNYQNTVVKQRLRAAGERDERRSARGRNKETVSPEQLNSREWKERRLREDKLVADIIARVRRECEAQGGGGAARRGYTRKTTVMKS